MWAGYCLLPLSRILRAPAFWAASKATQRRTISLVARGKRERSATTLIVRAAASL